MWSPDHLLCQIWFANKQPFSEKYTSILSYCSVRHYYCYLITLNFKLGISSSIVFLACDSKFSKKAAKLLRSLRSVPRWYSWLPSWHRVWRRRSSGWLPRWHLVWGRRSSGSCIWIVHFNRKRKTDWSQRQTRRAENQNCSRINWQEIWCKKPPLLLLFTAWNEKNIFEGQTLNVSPKQAVEKFSPKSHVPSTVEQTNQNRERLTGLDLTARMWSLSNTAGLRQLEILDRCVVFVLRIVCRCDIDLPVPNYIL